MRKAIRNTLFWLVIASSALIAGCQGNVGVGLSVGVPIGNHGYMSVGGSRWY